MTLKPKKSLGTKTPAEFARARKALGQNFLTDNATILEIVESLKVKSGDTIIEIGPGHGELTQYMVAKHPSQMILIEKDASLIPSLRQKLETLNSKLESSSKSQTTITKIIQGDALEFLPRSNVNGQMLNVTNWKLVGNIPYYITGYLLRIISELKNKPELIVLTIQKEVAERICAKPPKMNLLAASVQFWGKPEIIRIIPRKSFNPIPKVDSAVIRIVPLQAKSYKLQADFYKTIKILFQQPRKTILNNLKEAIKNEELTEESLLKILKVLPNNPSLRPQNLSIPEILKMSVLLNKKR